MVTERAIYYAPEGGTKETSHNIYQLSEDFPNLYPPRMWDVDGIKIPLGRFPYVEQDGKNILYCSHDNNAPEGTFKSWIQESPVEDEIEKMLSFTTRLSESSKDSVNEVTIKERLSVAIHCDFAGNPILAFKNPKNGAVKRVPLEQSGHPQDQAHVFRSQDYEGIPQWEQIREFLRNSLGYFVKKLTIIYDKEKRLEFVAVLD